MTNKELKKLSRTELLEMLIAQSKEAAALKEQLNHAEEQLKDRQILIENAGSIAEASLQLNGVFEAAQNAAAQYLENIQRQANMCADMERQSQERAQKLLSDAKIRCSDMEYETQAKCESMVKDAELQAQKYWDAISVKIARLTEEENELKDLLCSCGPDRNKVNP